MKKNLMFRTWLRFTDDGKVGSLIRKDVFNDNL